MILRYWPGAGWASPLLPWQSQSRRGCNILSGQRLLVRPVVMSATQPLSGLWDTVTRTYQQAQEKGAAYQTETTTQVLQDPASGINFVIRQAAALKDKPGPNKSKSSAGGKPANPFLPYDEDLWVDHLSQTHTLLLNKFNVVPHHLLVVTRRFEPQLNHLTLADLDATCNVLKAFPSGALAFYNRGEFSGASQPHKHVQVVPLPLGSDASHRLPFADLLTDAWQEAGPPEPCTSVPLQTLPFRSWFSRLPEGASGAEAFNAYQALLQASGMHEAPREASYNLWLADGLMLLALRSREACGPVAANSLGFAGTMLVKSDEQLQYLQEHGPMHVLQSIGQSWD